jgi:hypothetical protein
MLGAARLERVRAQKAEARRQSRHRPEFPLLVRNQPSQSHCWMSQLGRHDPFAEPPVNGRYLRTTAIDHRPTKAASPRSL